MDNNSYSAHKIFYFSGTGNARRLSFWIADLAKTNGLQTSLFNIEKKQDYPHIQKNELIGFIFPVHGFITIWAMLKFILFFPRNKTFGSVYTITSLGACKFGKYIIPGWEGSGLYLPLLILFLKGYRLAGACPIRATPQNWTALIPGYEKESSYFMLEKSKKRSLEFASALFAKKSKFFGLFSFLIGIIFLRISLGYLLWGKFFLAKTNFSTTKCNSCGLCEKHCPINAIKIYNGRPFWKFTCESCMRCMNFCPQQAIQANLPLFLILDIFFLNFLAYFFAKFIATDPILIMTATYISSLLFLAIFYWIFFLILKAKWVNLFFEYLAPTKYFCRYREPDTSISDFKKPYEMENENYDNKL